MTCSPEDLASLIMRCRLLISSMKISYPGNLTEFPVTEWVINV